jgi:hypothetical protein
MRDAVVDAALAAVLKSNAPGLYSAIAALVEAGEPKSRIVAAIRGSTRNRGLVYDAALVTLDYLIERKRASKHPEA